MPNTIQEFVEFAKRSNPDEIYEMFENTISSELQSKIYAHADKGSPEPCRSALRNLGITHY